LAVLCSSDNLVTNASELLISASRADSTNATYRSLWEHFKRYCTTIQVPSLPSSEDTLIKYMAHMLVKGKARSIDKHIQVINEAHKDKGYDSLLSPQIKRMVAGAKRIALHSLSVEQLKLYRKAPFQHSWWLQYVSNEQPKREWLFNATLIGVGLRTMQRPSNLCMLNMSDITEIEGTYRLYIYKSKTDQLMVGQYITIEQSQ